MRQQNYLGRNCKIMAKAQRRDYLCSNDDATALVPRVTDFATPPHRATRDPPPCRRRPQPQLAGRFARLAAARVARRV